jgi:serine/threonine protein kinase
LIRVLERYEKAVRTDRLENILLVLTLIVYVQCFARKMIRLFPGVTKPEIENEIRAVKKLCQTSHPNIVQIFEFGQLKPNSSFYFIDMESCEFTLAHYITGADVPFLVNWKIFCMLPQNICEINEHIIDGLIFIHKNGEVHRDLSPQNGMSLTRIS